MISTLPLLFADGHFTNLDEMKDDHMEKFISFLVRCSNLPPDLVESDKNSDIVITEPPWWLPDLPFVYPIKRPNKITRKWRHKLKTLIKSCYKFYKNDLLMDLSGELAIQQRLKNINFIPKCKHTTNIYNKRDRKIIATIKNENMTYDLDFDSEIHRLQTIEFEKVIKNNHCTNNCTNYLQKDLEHVSKLQTQNEFLQYFELNNKDSNFSSVIVVNSREYTNNRINFMNTPYIPFSSQLGRRLATKVKYFVQDQTHLKRLDRLSRYLNTPPIQSSTGCTSTNTCSTTARTKFYKQWTHTYKFPGKTYRSHQNNNLRTAVLSSKCKPCFVQMNPLHNTDTVPPVIDLTSVDITDSEQSFDVTIKETPAPLIDLTSMPDITKSNSTQIKVETIKTEIDAKQSVIRRKTTQRTVTNILNSDLIRQNESNDISLTLRNRIVKFQKHEKLRRRKRLDDSKTSIKCELQLDSIIQPDVVSTKTIKQELIDDHGTDSNKTKGGRKRTNKRSKHKQRNTYRNILWRGLETVVPPKIRLSERINNKRYTRQKHVKLLF